MSRMKQILIGHHEQPRFRLSFKGERNMYRHLIAVEVSIESRTNQRMKTNGFPFNEQRLESLNSQAMQCRCPIK